MDVTYPAETGGFFPWVLVLNLAAHETFFEDGDLLLAVEEVVIDLEADFGGKL